MLIGYHAPFQAVQSPSSPTENASMTVSTKLMTADELLMLPDDGKRYELIEGVLNERTLAEAVHGLTAMEAGVLLCQFVYPRGLGAVFAPGTGFVLSTDPDTVRAPRCRLRCCRAAAHRRSSCRLFAIGTRSRCRSRFPFGHGLRTAKQGMHLARCRVPAGVGRVSRHSVGDCLSIQGKRPGTCGRRRPGRQPGLRRIQCRGARPVSLIRILICN